MFWPRRSGEIDRFRSSSRLASYSLLAPRSNDTGEPDGIEPQGPTSGHPRQSDAQVGVHRGRPRGGPPRRADGGRCLIGSPNNGKRDRNRGYIKVARELVKVVYVVWKKQVPYTDTPPVRPGQENQNQRNSLVRERASPTALWSRHEIALRPLSYMGRPHRTRSCDRRLPTTRDVPLGQTNE